MIDKIHESKAEKIYKKRKAPYAPIVDDDFNRMLERQLKPINGLDAADGVEYSTMNQGEGEVGYVSESFIGAALGLGIAAQTLKNVTDSLGITKMGAGGIMGLLTAGLINKIKSAKDKRKAKDAKMNADLKVLDITSIVNSLDLFEDEYMHQIAKEINQLSVVSKAFTTAVALRFAVYSHNYFSNLTYENYDKKNQEDGLKDFVSSNKSINNKNESLLKNLKTKPNVDNSIAIKQLSDSITEYGTTSTLLEKFDEDKKDIELLTPVSFLTLYQLEGLYASKKVKEELSNENEDGVNIIEEGIYDMVLENSYTFLDSSSEIFKNKILTMILEADASGLEELTKGGEEEDNEDNKEKDEKVEITDPKELAADILSTPAEDVGTNVEQILDDSEKIDENDIAKLVDTINDEEEKLVKDEVSDEINDNLRSNLSKSKTRATKVDNSLLNKLQAEIENIDFSKSNLYSSKFSIIENNIMDILKNALSSLILVPIIKELEAALRSAKEKGDKEGEAYVKQIKSRTSDIIYSIDNIIGFMKDRVNKYLISLMTFEPYEDLCKEQTSINSRFPGANQKVIALNKDVLDSIIEIQSFNKKKSPDEKIKFFDEDLTRLIKDSNSKSGISISKFSNSIIKTKGIDDVSFEEALEYINGIGESIENDEDTNIFSAPKKTGNSNIDKNIDSEKAAVEANEKEILASLVDNHKILITDAFISAFGTIFFSVNSSIINGFYGSGSISKYLNDSRDEYSKSIEKIVGVRDEKTKKADSKRTTFFQLVNANDIDKDDYSTNK